MVPKGCERWAALYTGDGNKVLKELFHNGVVVPEPPQPRGISLLIRGEWVALTSKQEEMAMAWAKKHGTPYVEDPTFVTNFMADFSAALGINPPLSIDEVDFAPAVGLVLAEREARERLTKEERRALAAERKARREELRERYGYATVDGERVPLANYVVEPSGIFMGRGEHPLRGHWKEGAKQCDITLNHSPSGSLPDGEWKEIVWQPESLWVARWKDKLSGKLKYVWLSDTARVKQQREITKFDEAAELDARLDIVRAHIKGGLDDGDMKRRKIATACYLIDALCLRVGDEKDADEADTIGATTLRPEHIKLHPDGQVEFRFLGKDSVLWHKKVALPAKVIRNLEELIENARPSNSSKNGHPTRDRPQLFPGISSRDVSAFLSEAVPWLSAKVFRTHHATEVVAKELAATRVEASDPEHVKWKALSLANREAAILCNHYKKESATWPRRRMRFEERQQKAEARVERYRQQVRECREKLRALRELAKEKIAATKTPKMLAKRKASYDRRIANAEKRVRTAREREQRARETLGKIKAQKLVASRSRTWNLGTSLKSYIDPRVCTRWGQQVDYDVLERYYPKALRGKFAWARVPEAATGRAEAAAEIADAAPKVQGSDGG